MTSRESLISEVKAIRDTEHLVGIIQRALMKSRIDAEVELGKLPKEVSK